MSNPSGPQPGGEPSTGQLIQTGLDIKIHIIRSYEEVIWKIRSGYVVILYGALTFLIGKEESIDLSKIAISFERSLPIILLIVGLSLSAFWVDYGYLQKKLRVIVFRDLLIQIAYDLNLSRDEKRKAEDELMIKELLRVAAESPFSTIDDKARSNRLEEEFKGKLRWNTVHILMPLYATTPALAVLIWLLLLVISGMMRCR